MGFLSGLGHNTPLGHYIDCNPMGFGQYGSLVEYCDPQTASSVFLIIVFTYLPGHRLGFGPFEAVNDLG